MLILYSYTNVSFFTSDYIEAEKNALASLKEKLEETQPVETHALYKLQSLWYHVILDIRSSKMEKKWIYLRNPNESRIDPYSPSMLSIIDLKMKVELVGPKDNGFEIESDEEIQDGNKIYFPLPLLKFITQKLRGINHRLQMTTQSLVFVDPTDMSGNLRNWKEVSPEDMDNLGDQPVWHDGTKDYIMPDSWR